MIIDDTPWEKNFKKASVKVSDGTTITGTINIREYPRLSDLIKKVEEPFLIIVGVEGSADITKTYMVNKKYILWVEAGE